MRINLYSTEIRWELFSDPVFNSTSESKHLSNCTIQLNSTIMITFRDPTTILIAEPIQGGKTFFFKQVLEHQLIQASPSLVINVYGEHAPVLAYLKHLYLSIDYVQGLKNIIAVMPKIEADERNLVVLDIQISEPGKFAETSNLTKGSDPRNRTVVYIVKRFLIRARYK